MNKVGKTVCLAMLAAACGASGLWAQDKPVKSDSFMEEKLNLTQEWDKVFPKSDKVNHAKITFHNRYGVTLAAGGIHERMDALYSQGLMEVSSSTLALSGLSDQEIQRYATAATYIVP